MNSAGSREAESDLTVDKEYVMFDRERQKLNDCGLCVCTREIRRCNSGQSILYVCVGGIVTLAYPGRYDKVP